MHCVILAIKYRSETMGVCMDRIRKQCNLSENVPITYAGRLDPMAQGLVLFLVGDMRFLKDRFLSLEKQYKVEFLLGCTTDTFDILGIPNIFQKTIPPFTIETMSERIYTFQPPATFSQKFPTYSSRKINGTPMFQLARNKELRQQISHMVTLHAINNVAFREVDRATFLKHVQDDIKKVVGDFRQEAILQSWLDSTDSLPEIIRLYQVTLDTSSGFYVRQWVEEFGEFLSTGAVTFSLIREKIGSFTVDMLDGELRVLYSNDPLIQNLTN